MEPARTIDLFDLARRKGLVDPARLPDAGEGRDQAAWLRAAGVDGEAVDQLVRELAYYRIPRRIGGYQVMDQIGHGGMGVVFKAVQLSMQREVALKILSPAYAIRSSAAERLLKEARAAGAINHPNVVTVFDVGEADGRCFMAMEYMARGDLDQLFRSRGKPLDAGEALAIALDCARGLEAIEGAGLIHCDLNPTNIFMTADGHAKIGDMGFARTLLDGGPVQGTGVRGGTVGYMAPEQARNEERIDIRADIFALGATLFHLLTGQRAYQAESTGRYVRELAERPPPDPLAISPGLDPRVAALVRTAMAPRRDARFQHAAVLRDAIEKLIADRAAHPWAGRLATGQPSASTRPASRPKAPRPPSSSATAATGEIEAAAAAGARARPRPARGGAGGDARAQAAQNRPAPAAGSRRKRGLAPMLACIALAVLVAAVGWAVASGRLTLVQRQAARAPSEAAHAATPAAGAEQSPPRGSGTEPAPADRADHERVPTPNAASPAAHVVPASSPPAATAESAANPAAAPAPLHLKINFQPAGIPALPGFLVDDGALFAVRGGLSYGWNHDHRDAMRERQTTLARQFDTCCHLHAGGAWRIALPDGDYQLSVAIGDPLFPSVYTVNACGESLCKDLPLPAGKPKLLVKTVSVRGGLLSIDQGEAPDKATRIDYVEILRMR
jgi:serine/threonine-protein kinase